MTTDGSSSIKLSVVVASSNSPSLLEACLASLRGQGEEADTEVIVVSNFGYASKERIEEQFPYVRLVVLPSGTTVPELRTHGITLSRGEIVALTEDNCVVDNRWCAEIKKAHRSPYSVIGGVVENDSGKTGLDWAAYFYEYGKYMGPGKAGVTESLAGNNVSYKKALLETVADRFRDGFLEAFIHKSLQRQGHALYLAPSAVVYYKKEHDFSRVVRSCYHHGRSFAGIRVAHAPTATRFGFLMASLLLPLLLPFRIIVRTCLKGRHVEKLWLSLPYIVLFMTSWAVGEFLGYLFGEGESRRKWT